MKSLQSTTTKYSVKSHHTERCVDFFSKKLKITNEKEAAEGVFFVSARESLQLYRRYTPDPLEGRPSICVMSRKLPYPCNAYSVLHHKLRVCHPNIDRHPEFLSLSCPSNRNRYYYFRTHYFQAESDF
uniref:Uncharacterized protein n=1 Tax=Glossina palpalis gambiensis TaxID=67801 RepID=A0A1B0C6F6_9MUSC